jgi:hypothetical protein
MNLGQINKKWLLSSNEPLQFGQISKKWLLSSNEPLQFGQLVLSDKNH